MIDTVRNWLITIILLGICVILLALIYKIARLEKVNGELRYYKRQYEQVCSRYGGWNCE